MSSDHSTLSYEKSTLIKPISKGSHKVKYHAGSDWDFQLVGGQLPIDLNLILPHYRARNQPVDHRMSLFVANDSAPIKLKVCRSFASKCYLEVLAETSDVTVWLPSDFRGQIRHSGKAAFSAGFINRILPNVRINESAFEENYDEDSVVVVTRRHVTFRMWDVQTSSPEVVHKELFRRLFGCSRKAPEHDSAIDWDFLLKD